jgi:serine/threonine protein kinase
VNAEQEMNDNEFKIMKHLSDLQLKGFPKVISSGEVQGQPYIVLEKLGLSIKDILKRNKRHFSIKCIISMAIQLIDLLRDLHEQGYIHCDLKPDNIMIGDYTKDPKTMNKLYLIDFGIS